LYVHKKRACFELRESTSAVTKSVRALVSVNRPQLSQKAFLFWCQWIHLSCDKKGSWYDVSETTSAVTKSIRVFRSV